MKMSRVAVSMMTALALCCGHVPAAIAAPVSPPDCDIREWSHATLTSRPPVHGQVAAPGDMDGDGLPDLVFGSLTALGATDVALHGWQGQAGFFAEPPVWACPLARVGVLTTVGAGDVNGDGLGDVVVTEEPTASDRGISLFLGRPGGPGTTPDWTWRASINSILFASALGDVNGDGYADFAATDIADLSLSSGVFGVCYIFHGGPFGPGSAPDGRLLFEWGRFVLEVQGVGDVNADGFDDALMIVPDGAATGYPRLRLYLGSSSGLQATPAWEADGPRVDATMAASIAPAGDVDRDGHADALVGYRNGNCGGPGSGCVHLYRGTPSGLDLAWSAEMDADASSVGAFVVGPGDLDGDGWPDVAALGLLPAYGRRDQRSVLFAWFGSSSGLEARASLRSVAFGLPAINWNWPGALAAPGDINGDGAAEVAFVGSRSPIGPDPVGVEILFGRPRNKPPVVSAEPERHADCGSVQLLAQASDPDGDPLAFTWTSDCPDAVLSPNADVADPVASFDGGCGRTCTFSVSVDDGRCGITTAATAVTIADRTPPVVSEGGDELSRLWPPNGRIVTFDLAAFAPRVTDACDPAPSWRYAGCVAEENGVELAGQCGIAADGFSMWVRARRSGRSEGRSVAVIVEGVDACGNVSVPTRIGHVSIPHDQRPEERCLAP